MRPSINILCNGVDVLIKAHTLIIYMHTHFYGTSELFKALKTVNKTHRKNRAKERERERKRPPIPNMSINLHQMIGDDDNK